MAITQSTVGNLRVCLKFGIVSLMDRQTHEPHGELLQSSEMDMTGADRPNTSAHMAHTAFAGACNEAMPPGVVADGPDFLAEMSGTLSEAEMLALPDGLVIEIEDSLEPRGRRKRYVREVEPPIWVVPVMRLAAERHERARGPEQADPWSDENDIATSSGVPVGIVRQFIARNRSKIGNEFAPSEMRRRTVNGQETTLLTEHFSPKFVTWAVASLSAALARHQARQPKQES